MEVDREPDVVAPAFIAVGLPDVDFVGLPTVVGLPVLCVVDATGLPLVVGLPDVGGLLRRCGVRCASVNAGDSIRDVAATKPRIVAETRIRVPPWSEKRKRDATSTVCNSAEIRRRR